MPRGFFFLFLFFTIRRYASGASTVVCSLFYPEGRGGDGGVCERGREYGVVSEIELSWFEKLTGWQR